MSESAGLESVTKLIEELANKLAENRQIKSKIELLAQQIVEKENEKLEVLTKYTDTDALELLEHEPAGDNETVVDGLDGEQDQFRENLRLKIQLQKLKEFETKSVATIDKYEHTLQKLGWQLSSFSKGYAGSRQRLMESYAWKLQEEKTVEQNLRRDNEKLAGDLQLLQESLKHSSEQINERIHSFEEKNADKIVNHVK
jgi:hypothetical protein